MFARQISRLLVTGVLLSLPVQVAADGLSATTQDSGAPVGDNQNLKPADAFGDALLEDLHLIGKFARFSRGRIPERVVHAGSNGVHGEFGSSQSFPAYTKASLFEPRKNARAFLPFSTLIHPKGSWEALSDPRDFATKFYTDGDLVANRSPPARSRRLIPQPQSTFKKRTEK